MTGEEDDGGVEAGGGEPVLEVEPADAGHVEIEHEAGGAFRMSRREEVLRRGERLHLETRRAEEPRQ